MVKFTRMIAVIAVVCSSPAFSQHEVTHEMPEMTIHGEPVDHGEPAHNEAPGGTGEHSGGSGSAGKAGAPKDVEITLGPTVVKFSPAVRTEVVSLLSEYEKDNVLSVAAGGIAAIFSIYGLAEINASLPRISGTLKGLSNPDGGVSEAIIALSATDNLSRLARGKAARALDALMLKAATQKGGSNDFKVLRQIRGILLNPQRYKDGGIKYDKPARKLILRSDPGERFRGIAGATIGPADLQGLQNMTNSLLNLPGPASFLLQADYILALSPDNAPPTSISLRDLMIINEALLSLNGAAKSQVSVMAKNAGNAPGRNKWLWDEISLYPFGIAWNTNATYFNSPQYEDPLGFPDDALSVSDLVGS